MANLVSVECAVWSSEFSKEMLEALFHMKSKIGWSKGDLNQDTGIDRDRTYCRFEFGILDISDSETLNKMTAINDLWRSAGVSNTGTRSVIYIYTNNDNSEIHIPILIMRYSVENNSSICIRMK